MRRHHALMFAALVLAGVALVSYFASGRLTAPGAPETNSQAASLTARVHQIEAGTASSPLVSEQPRRGSPTVTFLAKSDGDVPPRIVSDVTGWGERANGSFDYTVGKMTRVAGTSWYSLETTVEPYARIEYLIAYGPGDYRMDVHNPRKVLRTAGPASEVILPGYMPPQEFVDEPTQPSGAVTEASVESRAIGGARRLIIYTPPGYTSDGRYPLAVFHDGGLVVNTGEAPRVLDWLIAHQAIAPLVAVFVDPQSRTDDYRRGASMRTFVTQELLPWLASRYSISKDANDRAIIGLSAGARGALDAASSSPAFHKLGVIIPAFDDKDIDAIPPSDHHRLTVSIVAARYDALNLAAARAAQLTLTDRGHKVDFKEVPEGHSTATWRNHLRDVLIVLFKK